MASSFEYRYFVAAYNCRSFSDAARKMNISSQGIGKAIRSLESQLGVTFFERTPQGIRPTKIATTLYPIVCNILAEEDKIEAAIQAARKPASVQYLIGRDSRLGDAINEALVQYGRERGIRIEALLTRDTETEQARQFVDRGYDYRFLSVELDDLPELPHAQICTLHYVPVVNSMNELAGKQSITIEDLRGRTVLAGSATYTPLLLLAKRCREHGFELSIRAIDKTYIWEVLRDSASHITFIRTNEIDQYPWNLSQYKIVPMDPPLDTQIVLQTSRDSLDDELVSCIRANLARRHFD